MVLSPANVYYTINPSNLIPTLSFTIFPHCFVGRDLFPISSISFLTFGPLIIIILRRSRLFFICGQSPRILAAPSQALRRSGICVGSATFSPLKTGYFRYLPPLKGSSSFPNIVSCSPILSSSNWLRIYSVIFCLFFPTVST